MIAKTSFEQQQTNEGCHFWVSEGPATLSLKAFGIMTYSMMTVGIITFSATHLAYMVKQ